LRIYGESQHNEKRNQWIPSIRPFSMMPSQSSARIHFYLYVNHYYMA
jgi:hypothetical protein